MLKVMETHPCLLVTKHVNVCNDCQNSLNCSPGEKILLKSINLIELFVYIFTLISFLYLVKLVV